MMFGRSFLFGPLRMSAGDEPPGGDTPTPPSGAEEGTKKEDSWAKKKAKQSKDKFTAQMATSMGEYAAKLQEVLGPHQKLAEQFTAMQKANELLTKSGGDFFQKFHSGGEYSGAMQNMIQQSQDFFGNAERGVTAMTALATGMRSFVGISAGTQVAIGEVTMKMSEMGFKAEDIAKALDNQAMAFGTNQDELKGYALSMSRLSNTLFVEPTKLMKEFDMAQQDFAYNSERTFEVFTKLQEQSAKTGVEFSKLAGNFGEGMDKFGDVTGIAGKLNAILGSSVFNPLELLNMDEAARVAKIREGIKGSPILQGKDINDLNKFELKSIASTLNMSVLETRKLLTGQGDARMATQKKLDDRIDARGGPEQLLKVDSTTRELKRLEDTIRNVRGGIHNTLIDVSKQTAEKAGDIFVSGVEKTLNLQAGALGGRIADAAMISERIAGGRLDKTGLQGLSADEVARRAQETSNTAGLGSEINKGGASGKPFTRLGDAGSNAAMVAQITNIFGDSPMMKALAHIGAQSISAMLDGGKAELAKVKEETRTAVQDAEPFHTSNRNDFGGAAGRPAFLTNLNIHGDSFVPGF